ncbi:MAG: SRPBCC family protein [Acetobacteraceae bacterium]
MSRSPATQVRSFHLDAPLTRVFPLFTARGETAWAPGWEPDLLSGQEERGSVFRTRHGGRETTWIVADYRPAQGRVSYARLAGDSNMGLVDVQCSAAAGGGTDISVRYTLTGLNPQGDAFVDEFLEPEHYGRMIKEWRAAISQALAAHAPAMKAESRASRAAQTAASD